MHRLACLLFATAVALLARDVNDDLLNAARRGDLDTVKALIEKGAPMEAKTPYGQTPLYLAAMSGHDAVVQFLLDKGAKTDVRDTFYKASLLDFVLERKHYAVAKMIIVKFLLDKGAKTDERDTFYKASLLDFVLERKHYAVAKMIIVKFLLDKGAKTD